MVCFDCGMYKYMVYFAVGNRLKLFQLRWWAPNNALNSAAVLNSAGEIAWHD